MGSPSFRRSIEVGSMSGRPGDCQQGDVKFMAGDVGRHHAAAGILVVGEFV
jgi:hypothetical protein